ncbi:MAG: TIGR02757 family protein [Saprospiraceae bacterium]
MKPERIKNLLDEYVDRYNKPDFIANDPILIPHRFKKVQDIEIAGFWVAMLAWGQRVTIINKANELMELMDNSPHDFIVNHKEKDRKAFLGFKHRTFQATDTLYFLEFLQNHYRNHNSLETAFTKNLKPTDTTTENALIGFQEYFFSLPDSPQRTRKHVATPARKSSCKRLNMFLRWMVRSDNRKVDFGIWKNINSSQLMIPLDVHVARVATALGLLHRKQRDWAAVVELTDVLRKFDPTDPVKYDFALFGHGVLEKQNGIL